MKNGLILLICLVANTLFAHESREHAPLKQWFIAKNKTTVDASFMMLKNDAVYLQDAEERITTYPLSALTATDQAFVLDKYKQIEMLNNQSLTPISANEFGVLAVLNQNVWLIGFRALPNQCPVEISQLPLQFGIG